MKKAVYFFLLSVFLLTGCSKPIKEEQRMIRLPAETAEEEARKIYSYLQKVELRNEDIIARPYFFIEGRVEGNQAMYKKDGISAEIFLLNPDTPDITSTLKECKDKTLERLKEETSVLSSMISVNEDPDLVEISYVKEVTHEEEDKVISYRYPCKSVFKMETLADGSYLLLSLAIDNEETVQMTEILLAEFLDAYSISFN